MNQIANDPTKGLSKLQKAILVDILGWEQWFAENTGRIPEISWSLRHSYYGGPHPATGVFDGRTRFEKTEKAAVSRALKRLWKRDLVRVFVTGRAWINQTTHVLLTPEGQRAAITLQDAGGDHRYRNIWEEGKEKQIEEVIELLRVTLDKTDLTDQPEFIEKIIPLVRADPWRFLAKNIGLLAHWMSLGDRKG